MTHYHIYPSFHADSRTQVENVLRRLNEKFTQNQFKIWRFENSSGFNLEKKTNFERIQALRNSKLVLCFLSKQYIDHDNLKFDLILADSIKKRVILIILDDVADEILNQIRSLNAEVSILNVSKQKIFFENGCFQLFQQFVEDIDRHLEICKYTGSFSHPCVPVYHFKCRYDPNDKNCTKKTYTRTDSIFVS